jgi:SAM-dependent methyltransferase
MFLRSWYVRRELKKLRKKIGEKELSIYDAGSGYAQYTYFMVKHLKPCSIYSVDIKDDWIDESKKFFQAYKIDNVSFSVEDLTKINHENKFDLIVCIDVMEHIEDDVKVFQNYYHALKKDEESFIGEHARDGYSKEDFESKLHPVGFETYQSTYTYGFWGDKAWRLGIKFPMLLLNVSKIFFIVLPFYYLITLPFTFLMMYIDYSTNNKIGSGINFIAQKK